MNAEQIELNEDEYEEYLNEIYGDVKICGFNYQQGTLLKEIDPTAFSCGMNDYDSFNEKWKCTECDEEYDNFDDAEKCCNE